jgi:hypothetical protein
MNRKPLEEKELVPCIPGIDEHSIDDLTQQNLDSEPEAKSEQRTFSTFYQGAKYGRSLNEALFGPSRSSSTLDPKFPNFDILEGLFDDSTDCKEGQAGLEQQYFDIPSFVRTEFVNCNELLQNSRQNFSPNNFSFSPGTQFLYTVNYKHLQYKLQVISF